MCERSKKIEFEDRIQKTDGEEEETVFGKVHIASGANLMRGARAILEEFSTLNDKGALNHAHRESDSSSSSTIFSSSCSVICTPQSDAG